MGFSMDAGQFAGGVAEAQQHGRGGSRCFRWEGNMVLIIQERVLRRQEQLQQECFQIQKSVEAGVAVIPNGFELIAVVTKEGETVTTIPGV